MSEIMKKLTLMKGEDYWKEQYKSLVKDVKPMTQTLEQNQKKIQLLEEKLATAVTENGQLRDLLEKSLITNNELTASLNGVKTQYENLEATLASLGIQLMSND